MFFEQMAHHMKRKTEGDGEREQKPTAAATRNESQRGWLRSTARRRRKTKKIKPDTAGDAERRRDDEIRLETNQTTAGMTAKTKRDGYEAQTRNLGSKNDPIFRGSAGVIACARERRVAKIVQNRENGGRWARGSSPAKLSFVKCHYRIVTFAKKHPQIIYHA
ncbi:hypothetical protein BJ165DRAFT_1398420 [Panaeolus papilionaceus]|nr:hypothetical protein BJ165DRAFT_1398420 [Panaeolus papilionaceus]